MEKTVDREQIWHILRNLNGLEISYLEYSRVPKDFVAYRTYLDYFNNYMIKSHNLSRFYFPTPINADVIVPKKISDLDVISELINITPGYDYSMAKNFSFPYGPMHRCDYYSLFYMMEGKAEFSVESDKYGASEGDFYLIPPNIRYAISIEPESICICFNLRKSYVASCYRDIFLDDARLNDFLHRSLENDSSMTYLAIHTANSTAVRDLVLDAFSVYINAPRFTNQILRSYLTLIFAGILGDEETAIDSSLPMSRTQLHYQQIHDYLERNYQTATLDDVAGNIHFSKQYVCRIVKEATGETFNTILMDMRLDIVKRYLEDTDLPLELIAELSGFQAGSHLSRAFKEHFGVTPSAYRKEHHK